MRAVPVVFTATSLDAGSRTAPYILKNEQTILDYGNYLKPEV